MTTETDYDQYLSDRRAAEVDKHEEAMRGTKVRIAKIEAKRDIKIARERNDSWLWYRGWTAFFCLVAIIVICITFGVTRPSAPPSQQELQNEQDRYEICMKVEDDARNC